MDFEELEQYHEDIENVYKCYNQAKRMLAYFYALKRMGGFGFEYHILQKSEDGSYKLESPQNTLSLLQENEYALMPIKKDSDEYENFIDCLDSVMLAEKRR